MTEKLYELLYDQIPDYYSRKENNQITKNVVRHLMRERFGLGYVEIVEYENNRYGTYSSHTVILNSVRRATKLFTDFQYTQVRVRLEELLDQAIEEYGRDLPPLYISESEHPDAQALPDDHPDVSRGAHGEQPSESTTPPERVARGGLLGKVPSRKHLAIDRLRQKALRKR